MVDPRVHDRRHDRPRGAEKVTAEEGLEGQLRGLEAEGRQGERNIVPPKNRPKRKRDKEKVTTKMIEAKELLRKERTTSKTTKTKGTTMGTMVPKRKSPQNLQGRRRRRQARQWKARSGDEECSPGLRSWTQTSSITTLCSLVEETGSSCG